MSHFRAVKAELLKHMQKSRELQMASMTGYIKLLDKCGHKAQLFTINGFQMKLVRITAAKFIFKQVKRAGEIGNEEVFMSNNPNSSTRLVLDKGKR